MVITNNWHVATYLIIFGFFAYVFSAILSSVFIIALPMDKDWCKDAIEIPVSETEIEFRCIEFKNELEQAKYYHNVEMIERNKYLLIFKMAIFVSVSAIVFYFIPHSKGKAYDVESTELIILILALSFLVAFIVPWIYSLVLPPPVKWFPAVFKEINDAQVEAKLRELKFSIMQE